MESHEAGRALQGQEEGVSLSCSLSITSTLLLAQSFNTAMQANQATNATALSTYNCISASRAIRSRIV